MGVEKKPGLLKKLTIKEIAQLANVSEGTVDRVIHNRAGVSERTRQKIQQIIDRHEFSLNPIASALASSRQYTIGVLIPRKDIRSDYWEMPYRGIEAGWARIKDFGFSVRYFLYDQFDEASFDTSFDQMVEAAPDGVILAPIFAREAAQKIPLLEEFQIPYLFMDTQLAGFESISFVGQDSFEGGVVAARLMQLFLSEKGKSVILQTRQNISNHDAIFKRIGGYQSFFATNYPKNEVLTLFVADTAAVSDIQAQIRTFLKAHPTIEGVFVPSSRISTFSGFFPQGMALIGFDTTTSNIRALERGEIKFLISQKSFDQGFQAVLLLFDYLLYKKIPRRQYFSDIEIVLKENIKYTSFANNNSKIFPDFK